MLISLQGIQNQLSPSTMIDEMVVSGFEPSKEILKKVWRRCIMEMDYESDDQVKSLAKKFKIRMGTENHRDLLFNLQFGADYARQVNPDAQEDYLNHIRRRFASLILGCCSAKKLICLSS